MGLKYCVLNLIQEEKSQIVGNYKSEVRKQRTSK